MIYADNAATTILSPRALRAMLPALQEVYGNPSSLHRGGQEAAATLQRARESVAESLGCSFREVFFTSGGTEADNLAIHTAAVLGKRRNQLHIVSTEVEHPAVRKTLLALSQEGFAVEPLAPDTQGRISPSQVENALREETCLVSVMTANNETGVVYPISQIGEICRRHHVLFHTDAVQACGHIEVNMREMGADLLSLSAHKFHGPKGTGALIVRPGLELTPLLTGGSQERGKRAGTENVAGIAGMAEALREAAENMAADIRYVSSLRDRLIEGLSGIPESFLNGDVEDRLPGVVNFRFSGVDAESLLMLLDARGIAASAGSACSAGSLNPSHVLTAMGLSEEEAKSSVRFSLSRYNTSEEVEEIIEKTAECTALIRKRRRNKG